MKFVIEQSRTILIADFSKSQKQSWEDLVIIITDIHALLNYSTKKSKQVQIKKRSGGQGRIWTCER